MNIAPPSATEAGAGKYSDHEPGGREIGLAGGFVNGWRGWAFCGMNA